MRKCCIHHELYLVDCFSFSVRFIIYLSDIRTPYKSVACNAIVAECSLPFLQCNRVTRFAYHSATPVVAAATATTHNRGIAATTAVAGTGCFSCGYPYFVFARAMRLLILLLLLLPNMLKRVSSIQIIHILQNTQKSRRSHRSCR